MTETREEHRQRLEAQTGVPMTYCRECDAGPFCIVAERRDPHLCIDCADVLGRAGRSWTPENSIGPRPEDEEDEL